MSYRDFAMNKLPSQFEALKYQCLDEYEQEVKSGKIYIFKYNLGKDNFLQELEIIKKNALIQ
jgi:hypothetical protein